VLSPGPKSAILVALAGMRIWMRLDSHSLGERYEGECAERHGGRGDSEEEQQERALRE
jgi:hypothetical protein